MKLHRHVLVVDDDAGIRGLLRLLAERRGFTADVAVDGIEALQKLGECTYDLAIIDLMMPRLNGYDLVLDMSSHEQRPTIVVATAMTDVLIGQLDANVVHSILRKPFDIEVVGSLMTELLTAMNARSDDAPLPDNVVAFPRTLLTGS
ncbi:MAG TPA: response regulator [Thermoanaerobaculia bacterium]|nr:response regulator [Thermoanaerobaculia bacterium]